MIPGGRPRRQGVLAIDAGVGVVSNSVNQFICWLCAWSRLRAAQLRLLHF